jgi:hypothetical protein
MLLRGESKARGACLPSPAGRGQTEVCVVRGFHPLGWRDMRRIHGSESWERYPKIASCWSRETDFRAWVLCLAGAVPGVLNCQIPPHRFDS